MGFPMNKNYSECWTCPAGRGAEIGPLNIPVTSKLTSKVLYVDHLDTDGIKSKYPSLSGIVDIDRPMVNHSLTDTLQDDAPLDYLVASQVFEHVANPIRWLREIAAVLREGGFIESLATGPQVDIRPVARGNAGC